MNTQSRLAAWKLGGLSFAVTLGVWLFVAWPLPRYFTSGIPAAAHREAADVRQLIPGDHLQFMYYCWLAGDMAAGKTPLFSNLYEFNTGNDRERFEPYAYYVPFSLIYAAAAQLCGRACGWNLAGFISLWLTYLLTWLLTRRWTRSEWIAAVAALLGIVLPFRWINLFGGSPAGFAMAWIPAVLLGVDLAVREDRVRGGILAGAGLLLASWGDSHVFFFGTLAVPVWAVIAFAGRTDFQWRRGASYRRLVLALLPIGLFAAVALVFPILMNGLYRAVTGLAPVAHAIGPRALREVLLFAPDWQGFLGMNTRGASAHIYIGLPCLALILGSVLLIANKRGGTAGLRMGSKWNTLIVLALMFAALAAVMLLALGPRGPDHGLLFRIGRRIIPPYAMIRQPAKIFCLMPSFLAVAGAIALTAIVSLRSGRVWAILLPLVFAGLILWDCARQCRPTISLLGKTQAAYAAAAGDAAADQVVPRALVLPLWPGDSHYASVYQYFASIYRVRMVNGYNPFVRQGYFENVFRRFESVNQGGLDDGQINDLLGMGVRYILLHEDLFPEKVSPFPVTATLRQLLRHPRLELLCQAGSVWAFKIVDMRRIGPGPAWDILIPARRFEMEKTIAERRVTVISGAAAGGRAYVSLTETNASLRTAPTRVAAVSNLQWLTRARGRGTLGVEMTIGDRAITQAPVGVQAEAWTWLNIPFPAFDGFAPLSMKLALQAGAVDLDLSLLTAGTWRQPNPGETIILPAPVFFHAGYTDLESDSVVFRRDYDPQGFVFYGPKLPLPSGNYEITITFTSPAAPGTELGKIHLELNEMPVEGVGAARAAGAALIAGRPACVHWRQRENLPFNLALYYDAVADLEIQRVAITRLE